MKTIRIVCLLLAVFAFTLCAACNSSAPPAETEKPEEKTLELDLTGFVLMRSDTGTKEETDIALQLRRDVEEKCGLKLELKTDWVKRGEEAPTDTAEIILGNTTRRTDTTLLLGEWRITREGNRVYILAGDTESLAEAEAVFAGKYLIPGGCTLKDGQEEAHKVTVAVPSLSIGGQVQDSLTLCDSSELAGTYTERLIALLQEKTGRKVQTVSNNAKANILVTKAEGFGVDKGSWGVSVTDGKLCIVGRTKTEMKKAFGYLFEQLEKADGALNYTNESGKAYIHMEKQMTAEEYRQQKQLVIFPEFPEMIRRNYDYAVSVTMDKDTASLPVYDHVMQNSVKTRALNGDLHRRFSQFAFSGGQVRVDIRVKTDFATYTVAPSAKGFRHEFKDGVISVWLDKPDYFFIMLDDDLNSILSVFAEQPEFPDELPDREDPNVLYVDGVYETENGLLEIKRNDYTVYLAPGAVLNCRLRLVGSNNAVIGYGALVDPYENLYDYSIIVGGTEGSGHTFLSINGTNTLVDGPLMLDARAFNLGLAGSKNVTRNVKILSTMMTSDGISTYASGSDISHCFIYNGDNSLVLGSLSDCTYTDITIGTTCSAIFPQGNAKNIVMNDIYVFRVGEGVFNVAYNPNNVQYTMDYTINRLDTTDITYLPYYFRGTKMTSSEKVFRINNANAPLPLGVADPHVSLASRAKGTNTFLTFPQSDGTPLSENFRLEFTNLYVDGKAVTAADQIDVNYKQYNNPLSFKNDGTYTPPQRNGQTVNYKAANKVRIGSRQVFFSKDVVALDSAWLLPADEIRALLRRPDAKIATETSGGVEYVRSTNLVSAGLAKDVKITADGLVITPVYDGENLLLPDEGEISYFTERTCYQVNMVTATDADGLYYSLQDISGSSAGMTRFFTDEAQMYGAGKYALTFKVRADEGGRISAGYQTESTNSGSKGFSVGPQWAEYTYEFTIPEGEQDGAVSFWLAPNVTPFLNKFEFRDVTLKKIG